MHRNVQYLLVVRDKVYDRINYRSESELWKRNSYWTIRTILWKMKSNRWGRNRKCRSMDCNDNEGLCFYEFENILCGKIIEHAKMNKLLLWDADNGLPWGTAWNNIDYDCAFQKPDGDFDQRRLTSELLKEDMLRREISTLGLFWFCVHGILY